MRLYYYFLLLILSLHSIGQGITASFYEQEPVIDGVLDDHLSQLPVNEFPIFHRLGNPKTERVKVTYRIAYSHDHLYLYFETDADTISYHNLGYLWGDGYKVLIGKAQPGNKTNEYYDLAFSPSKEENYWTQRVVDYNFSQPYIPLSKATQSKESELENGTGFEAMIAWKDIYPYHPWFIPEMGYNIYFAKGIDLPGHGYFPNGYSVVKDNGIWDEELSKRKYAPIEFEAPGNLSGESISVRPKRSNYSIGDKIQVEVVALSTESATKAITIQLVDSAGVEVQNQMINIATGPKVGVQTIEMANDAPGIGNYKLKVGAADGINLTVLPRISFEEMSALLEKNSAGLPDGTIHTLQFFLQGLKREMSAIKPYESGEIILRKWQSFSKDYEQFLNNQDPYKDIKTPYRRAFKSRYDDTYQPYTINLPDDYDPEIKYPLLVFLHGSGRDEIGLLNQPRSNGAFIELAPYGRDKFRAYAEKYSQKDILEAIDDVINHFSVDEEVIIIGGFSMGGYGALRTFYEKPELYKGVAVFAGHPNLANEWLIKKHPNFGKQAYLKDFEGIPVFIYHGVKDASLSINAAKDLERELKEAGAIVTSRFISDKAHEYQDDETNKVYYEWLETIIQNAKK